MSAKFHWAERLNVITECRRLRWSLWQCPPFLFLALGCIIILSVLASYFLASRYQEPEVAALIVLAITAILLVLGNLMISGFNRIAEASRMKSEFIAIISHQLRSPLSIFKWTLDSIERERLNAAPRDIALGLRTLRDTTDSMIRLVNSLLEVSRIEARTLLLKEAPFSLNVLTETIVREFERYASASHIKLVFIPDPTLPLLRGDADRIGIIIENLITNAIHYTPNIGTITITTASDQSFARWIIEDQGLGIPLSEQKFVFQKFFRAQNARSRQTNGSGIGLYIAKAIANAAGGQIGFRSQQGRGSAFWFTLPLH